MHMCIALYRHLKLSIKILQESKHYEDASIYIWFICKCIQQLYTDSAYIFNDRYSWLYLAYSYASLFSDRLVTILTTAATIINAGNATPNPIASF